MRSSVRTNVVGRLSHMALVLPFDEERHYRDVMRGDYFESYHGRLFSFLYISREDTEVYHSLLPT